MADAGQERYSFEADVNELRAEDSSEHLVAYGLGDPECPLYIHLLSEGQPHTELRALSGKRIRVTIEVVGE